jgi:hypothetical protein
MVYRQRMGILKHNTFYFARKDDKNNSLSTRKKMVGA